MIRVYKETLMLLTFLLAWMRYNGYSVATIFRDMQNSNSFNRSMRSYFEAWGQFGTHTVDKTVNTFCRDGGDRLLSETFEVTMKQLKEESEGITPDHADLINQMVRILQYPFGRVSLNEALPALRRAMLVQEELRNFNEVIKTAGICYGCKKKLSSMEMTTFVPAVGGEVQLACSRCVKPELRACEFCKTGVLDVRPDDRFKNKRSCGCQETKTPKPEGATTMTLDEIRAEQMRQNIRNMAATAQRARQRAQNRPPQPTAVLNGDGGGTIILNPPDANNPVGGGN